MDRSKQTTYEMVKSIQGYGIAMVMALAVIYGAALFAVQWIERNEIRSELVQWSQTIPRPEPGQPATELHLPEDILALHTDKLERTGFYETKTDKHYLAYANPANNYILAKSEESAEHEVTDFAIMIGALFVGNFILLLGWWRFAQSKVRELFEVA